MSDAASQEPSPSTAAPTSTIATSGAPHRRRISPPLAARILATLGALLFALGAWMPWVVVFGYDTVNGQQRDYTLALDPGNLNSPLGTVIWSFITIAGILICPFLWIPARRFTSAATALLPSALYLIWTLAIIFSGQLPFGDLLHKRIAFSPDVSVPALTVTGYQQTSPGMWLGLLAIACAVAALILLGIEGADLVRTFRAAPASQQQSPRPRAPLPGASALTIGLVFWAVGTFVMPWASLDCSATPLFVGTCTGLSFSSVLHFGVADATSQIDPLVAHYAIGFLLTGGVLLILAVLWWRARSITFCAWATLWLVVASAFAWLADDGVGVVVAKHDALGLPPGVWVGENAVLVVLFAFILALVGLIYLWVDALRHRDTHPAASERPSD